jgi:glycosyltransferase involved in cell wall biosynthesis
VSVLVDSWYSRFLPYPTLDEVPMPDWVRKLVDGNEVARGAALWWFGRRHDLLALAGWGSTFKTVVLLERLFGRRERYLVVLQFIYVPEECWIAVGQRSRLRARIRTAAQRWFLAPVMRRALARAHVLSSWEPKRNAAAFGMDEDRFCFLPWPLATAGDVLPGFEARPARVLASGRTLCDWPPVFAAARGQGWELDVVCGAHDRAEVDALNHDRLARVRHDMPVHEYRELLGQAAVHLVSLVPCDASSGQRRVEEAVRAGTPLVVTDVAGVGDYVEAGETALTFEPGDFLVARHAVNRLLDDRDLAERLRSGAFERAMRWTHEQYMEAMGRLIAEIGPAATR